MKNLNAISTITSRKQALVLQYMPLARKMALPYKRRFGNLDALQIAFYGLVRASAKFDEKLGAFPSYAQIWIKLSFQEAGIYSSIVYIPKYKSKALYKANHKEKDKLYEPFEMVSLDVLGDYCDMYFIDELTREFNEGNDPETIVEYVELWTNIALKLNDMPEHIKITISQLYGLCGKSPISRNDCAALLNVHRNTIKFYHDRGIDILRNLLY
ncbi:hypothetical protein HF673_00030 [Acidithiobacillus thiooxidans]|uniref:hypothetical protein n=1 Tax=Acidithiobacillus thiooxidans TaxID=930 RepID=UPI001C067015|nr:hypothetical protein [Acidithiobacillus thiooxidans]MBU2834205.1 hypothetical protein [Acidithiobacillus thiooxidans]